MKAPHIAFSTGAAALVGAMVAAACCAPTLILLVFGVGSAALGAALARHHWWFLGMGAAVLASAYWRFIRERRTCSSQACATPRRWPTLASLLVGTLVIGALAANSLAPLILPSPSDSPIPAGTTPGLAAVTIPIEGMTCLSCELHVKSVLTDLPGVVSASPSVARAEASVTYDPALVSPEAIVEAINSRTGYRASLPPQRKGKGHAR